ncbi:uncharacterized protein LOC110494276 [Oncorhynchus mykiss]|uniref:uncharacterized protein LOC110494276 n=1 Tax=Oncorhynchus mykiss TaxID=8022 RepID=UPI001878D657|nr:uncharacterized protein LOC110494276 [Oncorhynchus mykiss]
MVIYHLVASCNLACATVLVRCHSRDQIKTCSGGDQTRERGIGAEPLGPFPLPSLLFISPRLQWFLHSLMCAFCLAVSFLYWSLDYPMENHPLSPFNLKMHMGNSAQALLDLLLSATPIYLAHYLYQLLIGCLYILFAVVYWLAGQTNLSGKPYIYKVLDFGGCPLVATLCVLCFVLVCFPLCHFLVWNVQLLRRQLAGRVRGERLRGLVVGGGGGPVPVSLLDPFSSVLTPRRRGEVCGDGATQSLLSSTTSHFYSAVTVYL